MPNSVPIYWDSPIFLNWNRLGWRKKRCVEFDRLLRKNARSTYVAEPKTCEYPASKLFERSSLRSGLGMACPIRYEYLSFIVGRRVLRANVRRSFPDSVTE